MLPSLSDRWGAKLQVLLPSNSEPASVSARRNDCRNSRRSTQFGFQPLERAARHDTQSKCSWILRVLALLSQLHQRNRCTNRTGTVRL
ncbi:hypothetical protein JG688_00007195 [Phytophthora aleatoria]|uniref:Uncharacterized protein n=1 Tax=Phytophthora aleatoria TaxID=2496075 RepID=A0A8J5J6C1_9STRA|nr:hypothetical protein JG688_00007195 [Phytophthora aleatoria]